MSHSLHAFVLFTPIPSEASILSYSEFILHTNFIQINLRIQTAILFKNIPNNHHEYTKL